jgi:hypothetical protein
VQILSHPASIGAQWVRDGWRLIKRQPLGLGAMVVIYMFVQFVPVSLPVPYVGVVLLGVVSPFVNLGLMAAMREVANARLPTPGVFTQVFHNAAARRVLLNLGLVHAGLLMVTVMLVRLIVGAPSAPAEDETVTLESLRLGTFLVFTLVYSPVIVTMWFAPMLAGWHGLGVAKAMFGSAVACWRNKGAFVVYGVAMAFLLSGIIAVASALIGALLSAQMMPVFAAPIVLALTTFVQATFYPMYRSIFAEPAVTATA